MARDEANLLDIERALRLILEFTAGMDQAAFSQDLKTQSAVLHQLMVIGEAVKRLSSEFRDAHPAIPWRLIAGMRDRLIHHYDEVDLDEVWRVIEKDMTELITWLEQHLPSQSHDEKKAGPENSPG
jgi:uncharacterized protein with HEPN domain